MKCLDRTFGVATAIVFFVLGGQAHAGLPCRSGFQPYRARAGGEEVCVTDRMIAFLVCVEGRDVATRVEEEHATSVRREGAGRVGLDVPLALPFARRGASGALTLSGNSLRSAYERVAREYPNVAELCLRATSGSTSPLPGPMRCHGNAITLERHGNYTLAPTEGARASFSPAFVDIDEHGHRRTEPMPLVGPIQVEGPASFTVGGCRTADGGRLCGDVRWTCHQTSGVRVHFSGPPSRRDRGVFDLDVRQGGQAASDPCEDGHIVVTDIGDQPIDAFDASIVTLARKTCEQSRRRLMPSERDTWGVDVLADGMYRQARCACF